MIILYNLGTIISGFTIYLGLSHYDLYPYLLPIYGFFVWSGYLAVVFVLFRVDQRSTYRVEGTVLPVEGSNALTKPCASCV